MPSLRHLEGPSVQPPLFSFFSRLFFFEEQNSTLLARRKRSYNFCLHGSRSAKGLEAWRRFSFPFTPVEFYLTPFSGKWGTVNPRPLLDRPPPPPHHPPPPNISSSLNQPAPPWSPPVSGIVPSCVWKEFCHFSPVESLDHTCSSSLLVFLWDVYGGKLKTPPFFRISHAVFSSSPPLLSWEFRETPLLSFTLTPFFLPPDARRGLHVSLIHHPSTPIFNSVTVLPKTQEEDSSPRTHVSPTSMFHLDVGRRANTKSPWIGVI